MYKQVQVEPAKSNKSKCTKCKKVIQKGQLRAKMVDDREFKEYLRRNPDARGCEGYSRGYFQDGHRVISIKKYFVHLKCYKPIYPHPRQAKYFKLLRGSAAERKLFKDWLDGDNNIQPPAIEQNKTKKSKSKSKAK